MQVDKNSYPTFDQLKHNYNDSDSRVKWCSKHVVDFAFLFYYAQNLSSYYLHLEDDVVCSSGFVTKIINFIDEQKELWINLRFSELGFIGNVFVSF